MIFNMTGKGGQALLVVDTLDANGGTIRTITGKVSKDDDYTIPKS